LNAFVGEWVAGEATIGPEVPHVMWADPHALGGIATTKGLNVILDKALAIMRR